VVIDPTTEKGARADARLRAELVAWLITVSPDGQVYSQRDKPKLRHIAVNPRVALALRTDELGDEITVISGTAVVDPASPSPDRHPGYVEKYGSLIERLGADPVSFAGEYSVPIRITPTKLRQWGAG
jgi:PPOX class probable F420-dependent enzyme